jgi:hypothetical protein
MTGNGPRSKFFSMQKKDINMKNRYSFVPTSTKNEIKTNQKDESKDKDNKIVT